MKVADMDVLRVALRRAGDAGVAPVPAGTDAAGKDFGRVLGAKLEEELRFSAHAEARLKSREIPLSRGDRSRLAQATSQAARQGSREALLLMGGLGFIVSVPNRTVITALDGSRLSNGVITGIDTAVVVPEGA